MSCLLTDAYKASLNPIYSKVERQLSKDFISDIKSAVSKYLWMRFWGEKTAFENSLPSSVLLTFFVFTLVKINTPSDAGQPQNLRLYSWRSISKNSEKQYWFFCIFLLKSRSDNTWVTFLTIFLCKSGNHQWTKLKTPYRYQQRTICHHFVKLLHHVASKYLHKSSNGNVTSWVILSESSSS